MSPPALGHPKCQIPPFPFVHEKEVDALGVLPQHTGTAIDHYSQPWDSVAWGTPLGAIMASALG